jgi:hypothetical protein
MRFIYYKLTIKELLELLHKRVYIFINSWHTRDARNTRLLGIYSIYSIYSINRLMISRDNTYAKTYAKVSIYFRLSANLPVRGLSY